MLLGAKVSFEGPPSIAPVELRITGPDLETLKALGAEALPMVADLALITHARDSLGSGPPKLLFDLDETKVLAAGFTLDQVALELKAAMDGTVGGDVIEGVERLPIRVLMNRNERGDFDVLRTLSLVSPETGQAVSVSALGTMQIVPSTQQITRHDGERVNTLELFPRTGVLPQAVVDAAVERLEAGGLDLPSGYRIEIGGDTDARAITIDNMVRPIPVLLMLGLMVFVLTFNSFRLALVAAFACVLFAGFAFLSVAAFGFPLGVATVVGIIGSIGVSINDTIVVLTALQEDDRASDGEVEAMADTVLDQVRHVLSTTLTTVVWFLPLALGGRILAALRRCDHRWRGVVHAGDLVSRTGAVQAGLCADTGLVRPRRHRRPAAVIQSWATGASDRATALPPVPDYSAGLTYAGRYNLVSAAEDAYRPDPRSARRWSAGSAHRHRAINLGPSTSGRQAPPARANRRAGSDFRGLAKGRPASPALRAAVGARPLWP